MVSKVKMYTNNKNSTIEDATFPTHKGRNVLTINALFDGGADGGAFQQELTSMLDNLEDKVISVGTAIGIQTKTYNRAKLKLIGRRFGDEIIHNTSAIGLE